MATVMASCGNVVRSGLWGARLDHGTTVLPPPLVLQRPVEARKEIQGKVVSTARDKTVAVLVERMVVDPKSKRRIRRSKKLHAHDPDNACKLDDFVTLASCRPISKTKHFIVTDIKEKQQRRRPPPPSSSPPPQQELPPLQSMASPVEEAAS